MSSSLQTMGFFMSDINFCNTKEQLTHLGEVVTGKVDGSPTGADIDTSTLTYTGQVRKTLPALEDEYEQSITDKEAEADAVIDTYRLLNKGPYASGITLESKFEFITYNGESYFATNPPYTTTATTPDADANLFIGSYVNTSQAEFISDSIASSGDNQIIGGIVWPKEVTGTAAVGDTGLSSVTHLRDSSEGFIYKLSTQVSGDITSLDFNLLTATIGGVDVTLSNQSISDVYGTFIRNTPANPQDYGVSYGTGKSQTEREDNSGALQELFNIADHIRWTGITETHGELLVQSSQHLESVNSAKAGIRGFHPTEATITDGTITQPDDINNNTSGVILDNIQIQSANGDAIHVTPFKWQLNHARIQAPNGKGFRYHAGGYQVENRFFSTEFKNCGEGIYNGGGAYSATDQFIESCVFENAGILGHAVNMRLPSGLTHTGNHYFGGALYEFVKFTGGINCNSTNNYYEQMPNPRMWLDGGNPQSWTISDKIWGGDGSQTDYNGDQSSLIRLTVQPFARMGMTFNSIFEGGTNECPIFSLVDANDASSLGGVEVQFGKNNVLSGSYSKFNQTVSPLGCGNIIQSDHPSLIQRVDQADALVTNPNLFRFTGSKYVLFGAGTSTVNSAGMPSSPRWCRDKPLIITNASAANFVLNSPIAINGISTILPGVTVSVTQHPINVDEYLVEPV